MFFDAKHLDDGLNINARICIIGGGAAGITIAREFAGSDTKIVLVESGALQYDEETQDLYKGENAGEHYDPLNICRLRFFGGATNHWGGWTRPLDSMDFSKREWIPESGWAINARDLEPWRLKTEEILQLGNYSYHTESWEKLANKRLSIDRGNIESRVFRISPPTRFGLSYRDVVHSAQNIYCLLNANLIDFDFNESGTAVRVAHLKTLRGNSLKITADIFILATGGIENARILLSSRKKHRNGIGNKNDLVGRYFSDHSGSWGGNLVFSNPKRDMTFYQLHTAGRKTELAKLMASLTFAPKFIEENELPNFCAFTTPISPEVTPYADEKRARKLQKSAHALSIFYESASKYGRASLPPTPGMHALRQLIMNVEPVPNYDSRITLSHNKDALGVNRSILTLKHHRYDETFLQDISRLMALQFGANSIGRIYLNKKTLWPPYHREYGRHHMGTTRMSDNPNSGVVDKNCLIHGMANLYVAGSSVFPTYGYAQPTYTIVALSLRLANHVKQTVESIIWRQK